MAMSESERETFVARPLTAVLATTGPHGRIHAVPVWYRYADGAFIILTERGSQKVRNVQRSGRATLCIDEREGAIRYLSAEGAARIEDPVSYDERLALHVIYRGEAAARRVVDAGGHERMVKIVLTPERWIGQ
jgi:PPOX class probable F420-dependent enzyme